MDIEKLIAEARPGNFTVSTVLDNLVAGDEVRIELQSGNKVEGTVKFKNSKTLALDVPDFGFWACRVSMIAGVGIPDKSQGIKWQCDKCGKVILGLDPNGIFLDCSCGGRMIQLDPLTDERDTNKEPGYKNTETAPFAEDSDITIRAYTYQCDQCKSLKTILESDISKVGECANCGSNAWSETKVQGEAPPAQGWKCGGCGVVIYSPNQPRCEDCKRLMKKWNRANSVAAGIFPSVGDLTEAEQQADDVGQAQTAAVEDEEASNVPDEGEFEKTEEELEAERAI